MLLVKFMSSAKNGGMKERPITSSELKYKFEAPTDFYALWFFTMSSYRVERYKQSKSHLQLAAIARLTLR